MSKDDTTAPANTPGLATAPIILPAAHDISGLILAGGQGRRMDGQDKGLLQAHGHSLVQWTQQRLAPQVGSIAISANRNLAAYAQLGVPVWPDTDGEFEGPLAGIATGLAHCNSPFLLVVPCDTPCFPADLAARLRASLEAEQADLAMAATRRDGQTRTQPVFCLLRACLLPDLRQFLADGHRKVETWAAQCRRTLVVFEDSTAFEGANTPTELEALSRRLLLLNP